MKKRLAAVLLGISVGIGGAVVRLGSQQPPREPVPVTSQQIKENLWVLCSQSRDCPIIGAGGNIAVRVTAEGVVVVDTKFDRDYANILGAIRQFTNRPVKYIVNTHSHGDHTGGNAQFGAVAELVAQKNARASMARGNQPGLPRIVFSDETSIFLGGAEVQAKYFGRGHTNGDAVIYYPDLRVVHTGDLINETTPFNVDYPNGGSAMEWPRTLDAIATLDFDTAIPGHGHIMTRAEFDDYRRRVAALLERMTALVRQRTAKEAFKTSIRTDDLGWDLATATNFTSRLDRIYDEIAASLPR